MDRNDIIATFIGRDEYYKHRYDDAIPFRINDIIWYTYAHLQTDVEKIKLVFEMLRDFPTYALLMDVSMHYDTQLSEDAKAEFWRLVHLHLSSDDDRLAQPVVNAVWCDFFEDADRYKSAWDVLTVAPMSDVLTKRLLRIAGPIPFAEKNLLYQKLLRDKKWHMDIFESLLASAYETYGQIDQEAALSLLDQLAIPANTKHLSKLRAHLRLE